MDLSTLYAERRQQRTQQQRKRRRRSKPRIRRQPITMEYAQTWIPKESISQISAKGKSHLVWILAKREESKAYQKWIVPEDLIQAQGYYEGNKQLWLPKSLLHSQLSYQRFSKEEPWQPKTTQQWRPVTSSIKPQVNQTRFANQELKWVPKTISISKPETHSKSSLI